MCLSSLHEGNLSLKAPKDIQQVSWLIDHNPDVSQRSLSAGASNTLGARMGVGDSSRWFPIGWSPEGSLEQEAECREKAADGSHTWLYWNHNVFSLVESAC